MLAEAAPDRGINMALEWQLVNGGVPAKHCEAVGLFFAREYSEAAARLEGIAEDMRIGRGMPVRGDERATASAAMLADTYGQAANAWLLGGELVRAESAIIQALSIVPEHSTLERELRIDRARIAAADEDFTLALSELEAVWAVDRNRLDILILLASAARGIENYERAASALKTYMATYPDDPAGFLELGNLKDAEGDKPAARQAWLKVLALSETGSDADAARANLERIDVAK
ncbi:tetratricopeptide repeat protein [Kordiimonas aquimaris]|uniref:tetratricopeptide repeat protein n=1 Tax=Kordiimonas aquimaris TaxID=707591 RepID=UPI0021CF3CC4|nr:tetratricopeptide repeat protein [Kordiimonas aquimaris]